MAQVYAVASAKGGVGKTTTAANLGAFLADAGADVVVVDADVGMANLAGTLGVDANGATVHDVLAGEADPREAAHEGPAGLVVLPGETDLDAYAGADPAGLVDVVDAFADAEYVLIDGAAGLSHDSAIPLGLADEVLLVSTPEREALIDTEKTRDLTERLDGDVAGATLTRVDSEELIPAAGEQIATDDSDSAANEHLEATILESIPEDGTVRAAAAAGEPLASFDPTAPAAVAYRSLATELTDVELPEYDATAGATGSDEATAAETTDDSGDEEATSTAEDPEATIPDAESGTVPEETGAPESAPETEAAADDDAGEPPEDAESEDVDEADEVEEAGETDEGDGVDEEDQTDEPDEADVESVPFGDDDAERGVAIPEAEPSDGDVANDGGDESRGETDERDGEGEEDASEKGFFSRLLGR